MHIRNRRSSGLTLFALLPLSGCVAPWLDAETFEVAELRFEATGIEQVQYADLQQTGEVVSGLLELVKTEQEVRYVKRNRRVPTRYTDEVLGGRFSPGLASTVYWLFLPLTLLGTLTGNGSGSKPVAWKEVEGQPRRGERTGVMRQRSYPISAAGVEWELDLADGPVAGLVETGLGGRFTISFEQSWGAIRSSLDRMVSADLRLEAVDEGVVLSIPIDLLRVDEAIMRGGQ